MCNYHWNDSHATYRLWHSCTVTVYVYNSRQRLCSVTAVVVGTRSEKCHGNVFVLWCFISVWALWKIKISLCLWEKSGWGGEVQAVCVHECVSRRNEDAGVFFVCVCAMNVCVRHRFHQKFPGKNVTKGANHELTSAPPDILLWSQKYLSSSSPSLRSSFHFILLLLQRKHTAGFRKNVCSGAWKCVLVTMRLIKTN